MCCPLILCKHKTISEAKGLTRCQKIEEQKDDMTKGWEKRCELGDKKSWIAHATRLAKQGKLQAKGKDHHESSILCHMVTLLSNDKGNILR